MKNFFNVDSKFFQGLSKGIDCVCLSVIWLICCLPAAITLWVSSQIPNVIWLWLLSLVLSILVGPATTALYYTINKVIRHDRGHIWSEFWRSFKGNFKQSGLVGLILYALCLFFSLDCYIMFQLAQEGDKLGHLFIVFIVFILIVLAWGCYLLPYIARFEDNTKLAMKNAGLIALVNLPWTALILLILCLACLFVCVIPPVIFIVPAIFMLLVNLILEKIFKKYMSEEDIVAEDERNQEFFN